MNATHILYAAAGRPHYDGDVAGICRICGQDGTGQAFDVWVKDTFMDHDKLLPGSIVCHACLFSFDERSAQLASLVGKDKPQRMRNYSHFVVGGEWIPLSKGDKARMVECLRAGPTVAIVATSGQKHIIFRAQPGWWQIEEQAALPFPGELFRLLDVVEQLYVIFSKDEIATGNYGQRRIMEFGLKEYLQLESVLRTVRGTLPFDLALFLAQKGEDGRVSTGVSDGAADPDPAMAGSGRGVQTEVRAEHLGPVREQHPRGGVHEQDEQIYQPTLFEI